MNLANYTRFPEKLSTFERSVPIAEYAHKVASLIDIGALGCNHIGILMLKPELYLGGNTDIIEPYLYGHGFNFVGAIRFIMTPRLAQMLWQYEPFLLGHDRNNYLQLWAQGPSCVAIFESGEDCDASLTITKLKGGSRIQSQTSQSLRRLLHQDIPMLSFVHSCDEPLDVLREVGLILQEDNVSLEFGTSLTQAALLPSIPEHPPLNSTAYANLLKRLSIFEDAANRELMGHLSRRTLLEWPTALIKNPILNQLSRSDQLLVAAANISISSQPFCRSFPSVRHLVAR